MEIDATKFLKDVDILRQKRIIVLDKEIVDNTGVSAGNLSSYLSGRMKPSKAFLAKFYAHYQQHLTKKVLKENLSNAVPVMGKFMEVPLVNQYAYAGYLSGFGDQEYVHELPKIPFPVDKEYHGNYVCFEVKGS